MIKVRDVKKSFGSIKAVDGVSLNVEKGEVLGFLGPNGAGKTTTMRLITGYIEPDAGEIFINGQSLLDNPMTAKAQLGYLPENAPVYRDMHVKAFLSFVAGMRGLKGKKADEAIDRAVSICHLEKVYYQSIDTLSKGYMRRTAFAQAILHDPPILILDEPTDGLDPNQKFEVRQMIRQMGKDKAIIISTHILEEVDACCTRALIIANGKILVDGTPSELRAKAPGSNTVVVKLNGSSEIQQIKDVISSFNSVAKIADLKIPENSVVSFVIYPAKDSSPQKVLFDVAEYFKNKNIIPLNLKIEEGRLDDVFREITTKEEA